MLYQLVLVLTIFYLHSVNGLKTAKNTQSLLPPDRSSEGETECSLENIKWAGERQDNKGRLGGCNY